MSIIKLLCALIVTYLSIKIFQWYKRRRNLVEIIEKLPGPGNIYYAPLVNHTSVVLYLDSWKHNLGTFTLVYHTLCSISKMFPDTGISRLWLGWKPVVIVYSPENIEQVLNSTTILNKADEYRFFEPWIGEGLVTSKKTKWRFRRKILTPAFHFRILNDFLPIMNEEATKLIRKLNQTKYLNGNVVDITPLIALCTLDTICETAMGVNINCQDDEHSPYVQALHEVGEMALSRVTRPWLWSDFIFYRTETGRRFTKSNEVMHKFTIDVILERKLAWEKELSRNEANKNGKNIADREQDEQNKPPRDDKNITFDELRNSTFFSSGNKRLAFLDLLLHQHLIEHTMSIDDIREEVDTFMFAVSISFQLRNCFKMIIKLICHSIMFILIQRVTIRPP